mmetsp:Transcript_86175/g.278446  ORF Transcript_86175/g.278446 Transcript_86175/m.278446 type:complete len:162 (+) Transcript_86175:794-1279(+)
MRSRLEDTSPAFVASSARPSKGPVYPCQHFDDSDNEVEDAVPSGSGSGGSGFLMRTGQSDSYGSRETERLALQRRPSLKLSIFPRLFRGGMRSKRGCGSTGSGTGGLRRRSTAARGSRRVASCTCWSPPRGTCEVPRPDGIFVFNRSITGPPPQSIIRLPF